MVICDEQRVLFFENPRAASRSIRQWLCENLSARVKLPWHSFSAPKRAVDYYTFCVTRDPFSRLVSLYARGAIFRVKRGRLRFKSIAGVRFKPFLREIIKAKNEKRDGWSFFVPMMHRLRQCSRPPDKILRFERIAEEVKTLPFWFESKDFPLRNRSDREDKQPANLCWKEFYIDKETINLAIEHSWEDFDAFGYPMSL